MKPWEPRKEGKRYHGPALSNGRVPKSELPIGHAQALGDLEAEFAFFTLAPVYLRSPFHETILGDFMIERGHDVPIYWRRFTRPIFRGLATGPDQRDVAWNYVLMAVDRPYWEHLAGFLVNTVLASTESKFYLGIGEQTLTIVDPLAYERSGIWRPDLPQIQITAFGVNGARATWAMDLPEDPTKGLPTLKTFPPDPLTVVAAKAYLTGGDPVAAREEEKLNEFRRPAS